ncbi:MAG: PAS domain S-box protein, partial [Proteobacteria bacterium]|nr:PAS domain S-box protein [Pseudomonadota bacterium]
MTRFTASTSYRCAIVTGAIAPAVALAVVLLGLSASVRAQQPTEPELDEIVVAIPGHFPPQYVLVEDQAVSGFAIDVAEGVAALAGIRFRYLITESWTAAHAAIESGRADMLVNNGISERRKLIYDFTAPVETFRVSLFVREDSQAIADWDDLRGRKVVLGKTHAAVQLLRARGGIELVLVDNAPEALFALLSGQADAMAFPEPVAWKIAREARVDGRVKVVGPPLMEIKRAMSVRKGEDELLARLDRAVRAFVASEEYQRIYAKWYGRPRPLWSTTKIIAVMGALLLCVTLALAWWRYRTVVSLNRRLRANVAERERAEAALRESETSLTNAQRMAHLGNYEWDMTTGELRWSDEVYRIFGVTEGGLKPSIEMFESFIHPDDRKMVRAAIADALEHDRAFEVQFRILRADGSERTLRDRAEVTRGENGRPIGWRGAVLDITEQKRAEEVLRESEDRFKNFAEAASDWFWEMDENLRFTYMSPTVEHIVGVEPEWHYGKTREDLLGDDYDRDVWEQHLQTLKARQPFRDFNYFRVGEGIEPKWLSASGKPVFDADGNFLGYRGSGRDITELKQREIALRDSEKSLREILEKSPIGVAIVVHTPDHGRVEAKRLFVNDALVKMFGGASRKGLLEADVSKTWVDLDQLYAVNETMKTGTDLVDFEARRRRIDGADLWISMNTRPIRFDNRDCTMVWHFDITERKRAEEELAALNEKLEQRVEERTTELSRANRALGQSEERFRTMVEQAGDAMFLTEPDGSFIDVNQRACDALGYTRAELLALSVPEIDPVFSKEKFHELFEGLQLHAPVTVEAVHRRKDGTTFPVEIRTGRIELHGRKLLLAFARDITERKRAEAALRESEERLSLAVESANFGSWIRTVPDDVVILDERTEAIFGLEPGTFEGTLDAYLARVHTDDHERIKAGHERLLKDGVRYEIDYRIILPDGSIRHVATRASLIRDDRDSTVQIIGMLHDITERKRVEDALRESEEQLRLITDNVPAVIAYVDANQRYRFINKRYEEWFGISPEEAYGRRISDVVGEAAYDTVKENLAKALSGERLAFETSLPIKNAGIRHVQATYVPHLSDDGGVRGVFVLVTDITERKRLEEELLRRERLATLGQLTATVSHELRNPLGVIRTSAFILRDGLKEETPRAIRALDRIERSVLRCDRIIDEMLDFTRISDLEPEPTALDDWLAGVIEEQPLPTGISL